MSKPLVGTSEIPSGIIPNPPKLWLQLPWELPDAAATSQGLAGREATSTSSLAASRGHSHMEAAAGKGLLEPKLKLEALQA